MDSDGSVEKVYLKSGKMKLISTKMCKEGDLGYHDNLFGGHMMSWLDEAGASMASRICNSPRVVTVLVEKMEFRRPVKAGQLIEIWGKVRKVGRSSITLNIEARRHNVRTDSQEIVVNTDMKFVRIDEYGNPVPISERVKKKYKESK